MSEHTLHIIAFDIPYPPNYGGVIDVFYKIKALHRMGVRIKLHCFEYPGRERSDELVQYCTEVHYYPRLLGLQSALSLKPYIASSRRSGKLLSNLLKDNHPILFEGLHSCYYIGHPALKGRMKIYRESNIEHHYYYNLFKVEKAIAKKVYYLLASIKLKFYQQILKHATLMLVVSEKDTEYLQRHFPNNKVAYLPSFHANDEVQSLMGKGTFALYNGNIEVPENSHAVEYLIKEVFNDIEIPLVVAGMNPPERINRLASGLSNITIIANPDDHKMFELIKNAHVNILVTFQATGLKLKLLNTLYKGRFCLVNDPMLNGTGLNGLCETGNNANALKASLLRLFDQSFERGVLSERKKILEERYSNQKNGEKLIRLVFGEDADVAV
jgi:hypothetical protein